MWRPLASSAALHHGRPAARRSAAILGAGGGEHGAPAMVRQRGVCAFGAGTIKRGEEPLEMTDLTALQRDLVTANHILAREGVTDALGHISVRHPDRADRFFLSCSRSPELVQLDDIMEYDLDCNPID